MTIVHQNQFNMNFFLTLELTNETFVGLYETNDCF